MKMFLLFLLLLSCSTTFGEYRVYKLEIEGDSGKSRMVLTSLDPDQYPIYYPLQKGEVVRLGDTWMCWSRSDYFEPPCKKPE